MVHCGGETAAPAEVDVAPAPVEQLPASELVPPDSLPETLVPAILNPPEGAILTGPLVPVVIALPIELLTAEVRVTLDGESWQDPVGFTRRRWPKRGKGADYLATLDLLDLAAGEHTLTATFTRGDGVEHIVSSHFVHAPKPHRLEVTVRDADGKPTTARVLLVGDDGTIDLLAQDWAPPVVEPTTKSRAKLPHPWTHLSSLFTLGGATAVHLDAGHYTVLAVRGIRDEIAVAEVDLTGDHSVALELARSVPTPGQVAADLHVHTGRSGDSVVPDRLRLASLAAAGLEVVVTTDHRQATDPTPLFDAVVGTSGAVLGIAGQESEMRMSNAGSAVGFQSYGHYNLFPVDPAHPPPPELPWDTPVGAHIDAARLAAPGGVVQLNHPRGIQFVPHRAPNKTTHALFERLGFRASLPLQHPSQAGMLLRAPETGTTALDWDALEIVNRFGWPLYLEVRQDWFALLDQGVFLTGTGNSDSHDIEVELAGFSVNLVSVGTDPTSGRVDPHAFAEAIRSGRVTVSSGPVVDLMVSGADGALATPGDVIASHGAPLNARIRVRAASWVPVTEVRLVIDGQVVLAQPPPREEGAPLDFTLNAEFTLSEDGWVLAEAGWPVEDASSAQFEITGMYATIAPGYVPLGFTNPVRIDADGDGAWTPGPASRR